MSPDMPTNPHAQQPLIERITPAKARKILRSNGHNRNLRRARVESFAEALSRGEWVLNGETIKIAEDGTLLDGQHRLEAVIAAGVSMRTVVVRALPVEAQDTVDTGRKRRLADLLTIEGHSDAHGLAATINMLHRYRAGQRLDPSRSGAPTPQQALALVEEVPGLRDSVRAARKLTNEIGGPLGIFGALHSVFRGIDPRATDEFFARLEDGLELTKGDPVWHLRRSILHTRRDRHYAQTPYYMAAVIIKAFNYRRAGRTIDLLSFRSSEPFPAVIDTQRRRR
ncbi:MAG: hypothetical protein JWN10_1013 [Solirubrobacterales bacterium]|nr:hypothetical protein [Solirubrobacterales bacterium]